MKNIVIIKRDLDIDPILKQVYDNWDDWDWVSTQQR